MYFKVGILAFLCAWPSLAISAEFEDSDVFPDIKYIGGDSETARFISNAHNRGYILSTPHYFIYNRESRKMIEVDKNFHKQFTSDYSLVGESGVTSSGDKYQITKSGDCFEWLPEGSTLLETKGSELEIQINNKTIPLVKLKMCQSVDVVEIVNSNQLWLATVEHGGHGDYQSEGIVIQNLNSASMLAHITPISGLIKRMHVDPISKNVWVLTENGVYEISPEFKIISTNLYYHDFNPNTGEPRFGFSDTVISGNPFSMISRLLLESDRKKFYETVIKIPTDDRKKFTLYDFFMYSSSGYEKYPVSLQSIEPFFIKAYKLNKVGSNLWGQVICRLGGPNSEQFCKLNCC